jgi:hypothetical protein
MQLMRIAKQIGFATVLGASFVAIAYGQTQSDKKNPPASDAQGKTTNEDQPKPPTISADQEKAVLAFVSTHDTKLHGLLGDLKTSRPMAYQKALVDLHRTTERLAQVKRNRPHAYDLELKRWQAQSKVQLFSARLAVRPDPEAKAKLQEAIQEQADLRLEILKADREAAAKRLKQFDEQIATAESQKDSRVQQEFDRFVAAARRARPTQGGAPKKRPDAGNAKPDASTKSKE